AIEYAMWLWVPLLLLGARRLLRNGRGHELFVVGAVIVPHALYVIAIGGDHFEYRPFDLYFPLLFLWLGDGLRELADVARRIRVALAAAALVIVGLLALTVPSHCEVPPDYQAGFPGYGTERVSREF